MDNLPTIKIVVLGSKYVGKTALVVRFLTKRFIGEYWSGKDFLYKKLMSFGDTMYSMEILDVSLPKTEDVEIPPEQIRWGHGFLVVYDICDRESFQKAIQYVHHIKSCLDQDRVPLAIVGNKTDLGEGRQVPADDARTISAFYGCQMYEVSAAEGYKVIATAVHFLAQEIQSHLNSQTPLPRLRKHSFFTVSRMLGAVFGKTPAKVESPKRRTSFSL